jgi:oxygen-independent coproporphyrinogen-3 oxidase
MIPWLEPRAAYVHMPFCSHKCGYCDFASIANADDHIDNYLGALDAEMRRILGTPRTVHTIFVGGGTPTYPQPRQLEKLLEIITFWLPLEPGGEFTVESNPNTLDETKARLLKSAAVNRVSLGAQSFHPHLLKVLERQHDPRSVSDALDLLRRNGIDNISLDLIFGIPGQTLDEWNQDLYAVIQRQTPHCSTYSLTFEKGTKLWRERRLGIVQPVHEEHERQMYETAIERLSDVGFQHYEISNFARTGQGGAFFCRHNLVYWANHAYWGFGSGAASYVDGVRSLNTRELGAYIQRGKIGVSAVTQSEKLEPLERAKETIVVQLRRTCGVNRQEFMDQTGFSLDELSGKTIDRMVNLGMVVDDGNTVRLSRNGLPVADGVLAQFL